MNPWIKTTLQEINNLINNQTLWNVTEKVETVNLCMDVYKEILQSDVSLHKLKLRILVIVYLQNNDLI